MTKEELMARAAEAAKAEKEALEHTLLLDGIGLTKKPVIAVANQLADQLGLKVATLNTFIQGYRLSAATQAKAKLAVKLGKTPNSVLLVTSTIKNITPDVELYQNKCSRVFVMVIKKTNIRPVLITDIDQHPENPRTYFIEAYDIASTDVMTAEQYLETAPELTLEALAATRTCVDRDVLENFAEAFGDALGWSFSGPIRANKLTPEMFDSFKPYETLPYAGRSLYYMGDELVDAPAPSGKLTITPTLRSRFLAGQGVPNSELYAFRDFLVALNDFDYIEHYLEEGWALCECGRPVRTEGLFENRFCPECNRPIEDHFAVDINMPSHDYELILYVREHQAELQQRYLTTKDPGCVMKLEPIK